MANTVKADPIPLFNLKKQHEPLQKEINAAVVKALESMQWILGPETAAFEKEFAELIGTKYCVTCASGAAALQIALLANGVGPGDEVITTPFTFIATTSSISLTGAKFVFADIDPVTCNLDPKLIEKKITPKTKAILPVHLFGYPADMDAIMAIARKHNLKVIEDCAQSHLAAVSGGKMTGAVSHAGAFSFYPSKNLGACGDGGAVTTNDENIYKALLSLRHCGRKLDKTYEYGFEGSTLRMDEVQSAILRIKLRHLKDWTAQRTQVAKWYDEGLKGTPVTTPPAPPAGGSQSYYVYTIKAPKRDQLAAFLKENGIGSSVYYPLALYRQPVYEHLKLNPADFPNSEKAVTEVLSLPMFPELTKEQVARVCAAIKEFYSK